MARRCSRTAGFFCLEMPPRDVFSRGFLDAVMRRGCVYVEFVSVRWSVCCGDGRCKCECDAMRCDVMRSCAPRGVWERLFEVERGGQSVWMSSQTLKRRARSPHKSAPTVSRRRMPLCHSWRTPAPIGLPAFRAWHKRPTLTKVRQPRCPWPACQTWIQPRRTISTCGCFFCGKCLVLVLHTKNPHVKGRGFHKTEHCTLDSRSRLLHVL